MYVSKRLLALVLGLVLVVAMVACTDGDALRRANTEVAKGNATIAALNEQVEQGNATIEALNGEVAQGNAAIDALNAQVAQADERVDAAHAEILRGNESIVYLQGIIEQQERSVASLADANLQWERNYGILQLDLRDLREAYDDRNAQWFATRFELRKAERQLARAQELLALASTRLTEPPLDEERTIVLGLGGETKLAITRDSPGQVYTMDQLERSVRMIEDFMGVPFPASHVDLRVFSDVEGCAGYGGQFRWTHMVVCSDESWRFGTIAHETAHYYWNTKHHPPWLAEGTANFLRDIVVGTVPSRPPCELADNLAEFLQLPPADNVYSGEYGACPSALGTALVTALYRGTDDTTFRAAFRDLYRTTHGGEVYPTTEVIRDAFAAHATPDQLAEVDRILEERYGPSAGSQ